MKAIDKDGSLYSSGGLRFGFFPTRRFLEDTELLEEISPGSRDKIITEAHYTANWLHRFPEVGFLVGILVVRSVPTAMVLALCCYLFELLRAGLMWDSPISAKICRFWQIIKTPAYILSIFFLWDNNYHESLWLIGFFILQCIFGAISNIVFLPIKIAFGTSLLSRIGDRMPYIHNFEANAVISVIRRFRLEHGINQ